MMIILPSHLSDLGTRGSEEVNKVLLEFSVYIANMFYMTSDTAAPIIKDVELTDDLSGLLPPIFPLY